MNTNEPKNIWLELLAQSASTFDGEPMPPFGFVANTLAALRAERLQQRQFERIGWRAVLAALGALAVAVAVTATLSLNDNNSDFDPGVRSLIQMDKLPLS